MPLDLPTLKPPRKNTQIRLSEAAIDVIERLRDVYKGHTKSDIVEAAIMEAGKELDVKRTRKSSK